MGDGVPRAAVVRRAEVVSRGAERAENARPRSVGSLASQREDVRERGRRL